MAFYRVILFLGILQLCLVNLSAQPAQRDLLPIKKDKKWGFVNLDGKIVSEPEYEYYQQKKDYKLTLIGNNKLWGVIDNDGTEILPVQYNHIEIKNNNYIVFGTNNQLGVSDHKGNILLQPEYNKIDVEKDFIITYKEQLAGLYKGTVKLFDNEYTKIRIDERYIFLEKDSKKGLSDFDGNIFFALKYDQIHLRDRGIVAIEGEKQALYTVYGKLIIEGLFSHIYLTYNYIYITDHQKKQGVYNYNGKQLLPHLYTKINTLTDNIFIVYNHAEVGLATFDNDIVLPIKYHKIKYIGTSLVAVSNISYQLALFNFEERKFTSEFEYTSIELVNMNLTMGKSHNEKHYFNAKGEFMEGFNFDKLIQLSPNTFAFENNKQKLGVIDTMANVLIKPIFTHIKKSKKEFYIVFNGSKKGVIHSEGRILVPAIYNKLEYGDKKIKAINTESSVVFYTLNEKENNIVDITRYNNFRSISVNSYQTFEEEDIRPFTNTANLPDAFIIDKNMIYMLNNNNEPTYGPYNYVQTIGNSIYAITRIDEVRGSRRNIYSRYGLVDFSARKEISSNSYCLIDTVGFASNKICRAIMDGGRPCLITSKGNVIHTLQMKINGRLESQPISHIERFSDGMGQVITGMPISRSCYFIENIKDLKGGLYGYVNTAGQVAIPAVYKQTQAFVKGTAIVTDQKNKMGVINKNNDTIIGFHYTSINRINDTLFHTILIKQKYGLLDDNANIISDAIYDHIYDEKEGIRRVFLNKKYNYINREGKEIANEYFELAEDFNEGYAIVKKDRLWGVINTKGQFVIEPKYSFLGSVHNGLMTLKENKLIGYIDINDQYIIKPQFKKASDFKNGYAVARKKKKYGIINTDGKWVIKPHYLQIDIPDQYGISIAKVNKQTFSFVNTHNKKIFKTKKKRPQAHSEGLAAVCVKKKYGYIDTLGKFVIEPVYSNADRFSEGLAAVRIKGDWVYINKNDSLIINGNYLRTSPFHEGIAIVQTRKDKGFIDTNGTYYTDKMYDQIYPISNDRICIQLKNKRYIYQDRYKSYTDSIGYDYATPFSNQSATITLSEKSSIINQNYLAIADTYFNKIEPFYNHQAVFMINQFQGIRNLKGKEILKTNYERIDYYQDNVFQVWDNYRLGYVDASGNWIYKPTR